VQTALDILSVLLILRLAHQMTGSKGAARLSAIAYALYPAFILQVTQILSETLGRALLLASLTVLMAAVESKSRRGMLWSGVLLGLSILNKSVLLLTVPFLILWVAWMGQASLSQRLRLSLLNFAIPILCVTGGWMARNAIVSKGEIIPVSTNYPITFAHGVTRFCYYANLWFGPERLMPVPDNYQELTQLRFNKGVNDELRTGRFYARRAFAFMRQHPGFITLLTLRKAGHFWSPFIRNTRWAERIAFLTMAPVLLLGWVGVIRALGRSKKERGVGLLALAIALPVSLPYIFSQPDVRYRVGIIDPLWIIFAGWALVWLSQKVLPRSGGASSDPDPSANHGGSDQTGGA